jgi:4-hydroxybenzoate polyprenyltransferase
VAARLGGWLRVSHPFPSVLDGLVVAAVALMAGAAALTAAAAGCAMTLLQLGIGTVNDVVDAPFDAGLKPGKPIPAGLVPAPPARWLAVGLFGAGTLVGATITLRLVVLSIVVIGIGLAYDLRLKGTAWSWLPFAVGIPILPVYGWLAARSGLEPLFGVLLPVAVGAGAALAIGNALVDIRRDAAAGRSSIAIALGEGRAGAAVVGLLAAVWGAATGSAWIAASPDVAAVAVAGLPGVVAAAVAPGRGAAGRELAWRVEAVGTGLLAVTWLLGILSSVSPA